MIYHFSFKMPSSLPPKEFLKQEITKFDPSIPIERAFTPPSSWYTDPLFLQHEAKAVFHSNYIQGISSFMQNLILSWTKGSAQKSWRLYLWLSSWRTLHSFTRYQSRITCIFQHLPTPCLKATWKWRRLC